MNLNSLRRIRKHPLKELYLPAQRQFWGRTRIQPFSGLANHIRLTGRWLAGLLNAYAIEQRSLAEGIGIRITGRAELAGDVALQRQERWCRQ
jgi:hypothetical protein